MKSSLSVFRLRMENKDLKSKLKAYLSKANLSKLTSTPKFKKEKSKKEEKSVAEKKQRFVPKQKICISTRCLGCHISPGACDKRIDR